ncbi:SCO family protein [Roseivivax sp. GX 12232]|uniref:SCO family protein n=1 Tax=Roseivivax sp. GX 12232 TaxID=2900547 RepID=UPI001E432352|nr:SCO family protein [Roseivivax sp. GX 12232]MCE0505313.1 SCO family protein [Roseivivax sp. GX 12232]
MQASAPAPFSAHTPAPIPATTAAPPASDTTPPAPFPLALGGPFALTDQTGTRRTERAPGADLQLLFFGYANCEAICSVALPRMGGAVTALAEDGLTARPVMITVDPARDRVETIGPPLTRHHPAFLGLTGSPEELAAVYKAFGVEAEVLFHDPGGHPVYAHGSHIFLLDGAGKVLTLVPPILSAERLAEIAQSYLPR